FHVREGFDEESARSTGRVEEGFTEMRVHNFDHELHYRTRRVKLPRITCSVTHFPEHRLVKAAQRVNLFRGVEMDRMNFVEHVAQQIPAFHAVAHATEYIGNYFLSPSPFR